jgi:hypothetical protein
LLRTRRERPYGRAAEQRDELASPQIQHRSPRRGRSRECLRLLRNAG